jgi:hypothetical protein
MKLAATVNSVTKFSVVSFKISKSAFRELKWSSRSQWPLRVN